MTGIHRLLAVLLFTALAASCSENPVGRICFIGPDAGMTSSGAIVSSPALECPSRTCLRIPQDITLPEGAKMLEPNQGMCTALDCTADSDCDRVPESPCVTGFTCAVPVTTGEFCCRKMCMCKDYVVTPVPEPAACDANNPVNTCQNLPDR
jgi:hypothetical protein